MSRDGILYSDDYVDRARGKVKAPPGQVVYPIAPRKGPWSANPQLGQMQEFAPDSNNRQSILKLDEWGMPQVWTVLLGIDFDSSVLGPGDEFGVEAIVEVGSGGSTQSIRMDWRQGVTFCAPMNALNVIAQYSSNVPASVTDSVRLRVQLGEGCSFGVPPTLTRFVNAQPLLLGIAQRIPVFASSVDIAPLTTNAFDANVIYRILEGVGGDTVSLYRGTQLLELGGRLPIPGRGRAIQIDNAALAFNQQVVVTTIFNLDL